MSDARFHGKNALSMMAQIGNISTVLLDMPNMEELAEKHGEDAEVMIGIPATDLRRLGELFVALYLYAMHDGDIDYDDAREVLVKMYDSAELNPENKEHGLRLFDTMREATQQAIEAMRKTKPAQVKLATRILGEANNSIRKTKRTVVKQEGDKTELLESGNVVPFKSPASPTKH